VIIPLNAEVTCVDGPGGSIVGVIVHRPSLQVQQLVVKEKGFLFIDHLVPVSWLLNSSSRQIELRCTGDELSALEPSGELDGSLAAAMQYRYATWEYGVWPYPPTAFLNQRTRTHMAANELMLSGRTQLKALDGDVGHACELAVDPETYRIMLVTFLGGHFWHLKHVTIPAVAIADVTEERITVSLKRHSLAALLSIALPPYSRFSGKPTK